MSQGMIVFAVTLVELICTALAIYIPVKAAAIISNTLLIVTFLVIFAFFAIDLIRDVRDRTFLSASFLLVLNISLIILLFGNIFVWSNVKDSLTVDYIGHNKLLNCIYLSVVTWTTLGYGDITPTFNSRIVAASEAMTGYVVMALLIAVLVALAESSRRP